VKVEFTSEVLENTLENFSNLILVGCLNNGLRFFTNEGLGSGFTNLDTKVIPLLCLVVGNGSTDLMVDIDTVD
jgi:hypothetical protein